MELRQVSVNGVSCITIFIFTPHLRTLNFNECVHICSKSCFSSWNLSWVTINEMFWKGKFFYSDL